MRSPWRRVRRSFDGPIVWLLIALGFVGFGVKQLSGEDVPIVRFTTADDEVVELRSGTDAAGSRVGSSVRVLYDPANPQPV